MNKNIKRDIKNKINELNKNVRNNIADIWKDEKYEIFKDPTFNNYNIYEKKDKKTKTKQYYILKI